MSGQPTCGLELTEPLFTLKEIALSLRLSTSTMRRRVAAGELDAFRVGRSLRVTKSARDDYFERIGYKPQAQVTK